MPGLLDFLFGGSAAPAQAGLRPAPSVGTGAPQQSYGYDANGYPIQAPTSQVGAVPYSVNPNAATASALSTPQAPPGQSLSGAITPTGQGSQAPITVIGQRTYQPNYVTDPALRQARGVDNATQAADSNPGPSANYDGFKPRKAGFLGDLADYLLGTHIGDHIHRLNMEAAFQHYTSDPEETVRRLATFDPDMAAKVQSDANQTLRWNQYAEHMTNSIDQSRFKDFSSLAGNMSYGLTHDNKGQDVVPSQQAWDNYRSFMIPKAQKAGLDQDTIDRMLPPQYTTEAGSLLTSMAEPAYKMAALGQKADQFSQTLPLRQQHEKNYGLIASQAPVNAGAHVMQGKAALIQAGNGTTNAQTGQMNATTRRASENKQPDKGQSGYIQMPDGIGKRTADGNTIYVKPDPSRNINPNQLTSVPDATTGQTGKFLKYVKVGKYTTGPNKGKDRYILVTP